MVIPLKLGKCDEEFLRKNVHLCNVIQEKCDDVEFLRIFHLRNVSCHRLLIILLAALAWPLDSRKR